MKNIIIICTLVFTITMLGMRFASAEPSCPDGSYNIGTEEEVVCKQDPTGCPYGDSIPLDSPKCTAQVEQANYTPPIVHDEQTIESGK